MELIFELVLLGEDPASLSNENVDILVKLDNGKEYIATVFTINSIIKLIDKYKESGENASGKYFWASDMCIVQSLDESVLRESVRDMLLSGTFESVFSESIVEI